MTPVDLLRNFIVEHFQGEAKQIAVHGAYWTPLERTGAAAALELGFQRFLELEGGAVAAETGGTYGAFARWWRAEGGARSEEEAEGLLRRLLTAVPPLVPELPPNGAATLVAPVLTDSEEEEEEEEEEAAQASEQTVCCSCVSQ